MSPQAGEEVFLTELETKVLSVFVKEKILNDNHISILLLQLIDKLEGEVK